MRLVSIHNLLIHIALSLLFNRIKLPVAPLSVVFNAEKEHNYS